MERFVMEQRQCICCRTRFTPLRNPTQRYCANPSCQKKRRCKFQRQKLKRDADYKETHRSSQEKWRDKHPDYWRQYRIQHPIYAQCNRAQQVKRDQKRRQQARKTARVFPLANMYSLIQKNEYYSNSYKIILCRKNACKYVPYGREDVGLLA
jgi:hypothetical protein